MMECSAFYLLLAVFQFLSFNFCLSFSVFRFLRFIFGFPFSVYGMECSGFWCAVREVDGLGYAGRAV